MKSVDKMTSSDMAIALLNDPQFRIPKYPKVSEGFELIHFDDESLLVDGGTEKQLFKGKAVQTVLLYAIEQCDGKTPIEEILQSSDDIHPNHLFQALSLMYARGLLQEGYDVENVISHPLYEAYDRIIDGTRANKNVEEALQHVLQKRIFIDCKSGENHEWAHKELERQLQMSGCHVANVSSLQELTKDDLVICVINNKNDLHDWKARLSEYYELHIPFVFLMFDDQNVYIGPYIEKNETPCFECYFTQLSRLHVSERAISKEMIPTSISLVVPSITSLISGVHRPALTQNMVEIYHLQEFTKSTMMFIRVPNCHSCSSEKITEEVDDLLVYQYESMVEFPSRKFLNLKDHQNHYKSSNLKLTRVYKNYFNSPKISLPPSEELLDITAISEEDYENVLKILLYTTGIKSLDKNRVKRWSPTGGNLGSVQAYLVNHRMNQLEKGTYFYQPFQHELQQVTKNNELYRESVAESHDDSVIGTIILTGSIERLATKYHTLSFRLANLDAGVAFAQSQVVAKSLGYHLVKINQYDGEQLSKSLGVNDIGEMITIVAHVVKGGREWRNTTMN